MTVAISTLQLAIYNWVFSTSGITTIWAFANSPQPTTAYITLNLLEITQTGWDYETPPNDDGDTALFGNRELTLEVNYYGSGGIDILEKLRTSIKQYDVEAALNAAGLFYIDRGLSTNLTFLQDNVYKQRHLMEFRFRYSNQGVGNPNLYDVGIIERVAMEGEFDKGDGVVVITQNYDIDSTP